MNKLTLILTLFTVHTILCAQAPFGTQGTRWIFEGWSEGSGWEPNWEGNCVGNQLIYEVSDEITINGKICGIITSNRSSDSIIVYQEDGVVYFYEDSAFFRLFDFNAALGDTLLTFRPGNAGNHSLKDFFGSPQETYDSPDTIYTHIIGYDTIDINGTSLKRWQTDPIFFGEFDDDPLRLYETIIENIGSLNGILGDHDFFIGEGCYGGFVCYQSGQFQYGSYFFPMCDFTSSTGAANKSTLIIYPNPSTGSIALDMDISNIDRIEVFDFTGRKLFSTKSNTLNMGSYPPGVYLIITKDGLGNTMIEKLILK